jgi:hypothetical protein
MDPKKTKLLGELARVRALAEASARPPGRVALDAANPLDWDSTPTFYEASTIALGHLLHFKQVWTADGYSLGDLLQSIPLAPGQKKIISVVDWERRETSRRSEDNLASESLTAALSRDRDVSEVVSGTLTESMRGSSQAHTWGFGTGSGGAAEGTYNAISFGGVAGISGGYGGGASSASQTGTRSVAEQSLQQLRDKTLQSASAVRALRSTVVTTATQGETVRASTEVIANHNHCHAVTVQYFEVLRHFQVKHELADVQECLFVPLPMSAFTREKALRWRQPLLRYLQRPELAPGFDAMQRVQSSWKGSELPEARYSDEYVSRLRGELHLTFVVPLPPIPTFDPDAEVEKIEKSIVGATSFLNELLDAVTLGGTRVVRETVKGGAAIARSLHREASPERQFERFQQEVMPEVAAGFVDQLELYAVLDDEEKLLSGMDFTLVSDYSAGKPLLVSVRGALSGIRRRDIAGLVVRSRASLPIGCRVVVNDADFRYRAPGFEHALGRDRRVNDDLARGDGATLDTPTDAWEERNPHQEDLRLEEALRDHLNANFEYYHHAIWWAMDPNRRFMLLDGCVEPYTKASVASVVENRLIGIVGNSLVMPVARGIRLDPRFRDANDGAAELVDLREHYALPTPVPPARVSLPTRGVFAESVMGSCNACEEIDDKRMWRWDEATVDEPPAIEPVSMSSRRSEAPPPQATPFPTPMVAIQNAPGAPDPTGLRAISELLGKQSFPDITGLAGNIANAGASYRQAVETALQYGKEASKLAQQAATLGGLERTMHTINSQEKAGNLDKEEAKKLRLEALQKAVGSEGGQLSASDVSERLKVLSDAEQGGSIDEGDKRAFARSVLRSYVGDTGEDQRLVDTPAVKEAILSGAESPQGSVKLTSPDGEQVEVHNADRPRYALADTVMSDAYAPYGSGKTAPAPKGGVAAAVPEKVAQSNATGAKKLFDNMVVAFRTWRDAPSKELTDTVQDALVTTLSDFATDAVPAFKPLKLAWEIGKAFADGVDKAIAAKNAELEKQYRNAELIGSGTGELSEEDKDELNRVIRGYQWNAVSSLPGIIEKGLEGLVDRAVKTAFGTVTATVKNAAYGAGKQVFKHFMMGGPGEALFADALAEAGKSLGGAKSAAYRKVFSGVLGTFVRQMESAAVRDALQPLVKAIESKDPLSAALLAALAETLSRLLLEPGLKFSTNAAEEEVNGAVVALKALLIGRVRELKDAVEFADGKPVGVGSEVRFGVDGIFLTREVLDALEGEDAGRPNAAKSAEIQALRDKFATLKKSAFARVLTAGVATEAALARLTGAMDVLAESKRGSKLEGKAADDYAETVNKEYSRLEAEYGQTLTAYYEGVLHSVTELRATAAQMRLAGLDAENFFTVRIPELRGGRRIQWIGVEIDLEDGRRREVADPFADVLP